MTCMPGLKQVNSQLYEMTKDNYYPPMDLDIVILQKWQEPDASIKNR